MDFNYEVTTPVIFSGFLYKGSETKISFIGYASTLRYNQTLPNYGGKVQILTCECVPMHFT